MAVRPVRVAAVGCGYWGPNAIRNLDSVPGFQLCCVCDSDPERLRPIAARYPAARPTTNVDDLFDDASIDAVYLSTPVSTHYQLVKRALESGKHVLVEKPLATTVDQAEDLARLAARFQVDVYGFDIVPDALSAFRIQPCQRLIGQGFQIIARRHV